MAGTKMGVIGSGGRMGRMLVAEIAASPGCTLAGGCAKPGSGYVNQDIGELAAIGRLGDGWRGDDHSPGMPDGGTRVPDRRANDGHSLRLSL